MQPDSHLFALALAMGLASPLAAQSGGSGPDLVVQYPPASVSFEMTYAAPQPYVGAVIASLQPHLTHYLVLLPPLLTDYVLLGFGVGAAPAGYQLVLPAAALPAGIQLYAQGVVLDGAAILSSSVQPFSV